MGSFKNDILPIIGVIIIFFIFLFVGATNTDNSNTPELDLSQYPTVYSQGENLKEIYTNPIYGVYVYLCPKNSTHKSDVNLLNGIYIEKPTAKVKEQTVQNIFIFDTFPELDTFKGIQDYDRLVNAVIEQKPIMGFHRAFIKVNDNYYNQAFVYDKVNKTYIFYDGAGGLWNAQETLSEDFTVSQTEYLGTWDYKKKGSTSEVNPQKQTLENSPELQAKYKTEIEKTINIETEKAQKEIDKTYQEANELYSNILKTDNYTLTSYTEYEMYTRALDSPIFWLYVKLIEITEKYTGHHEELATDFYPTLAEYVEPIMKKYKVANISKLTELETYTDNKINEIEIRSKGLYDLIKE